MVRSGGYMAMALILALLITLAAGRPGLDNAKIAGIVLASLVVLPVFFLLVRAMRSNNFKRVLKIFVGGFFYKLIVLVAGVWLGLAKIGWETAAFTVSCLVFVFAYQVCESLYFWLNKEVLNRS